VPGRSQLKKNKREDRGNPKRNKTEGYGEKIGLGKNVWGGEVSRPPPTIRARKRSRKNRHQSKSEKNRTDSNLHQNNHEKRPGVPTNCKKEKVGGVVGIGHREKPPRGHSLVNSRK